MHRLSTYPALQVVILFLLAVVLYPDQTADALSQTTLSAPTEHVGIQLLANCRDNKSLPHHPLRTSINIAGTIFEKEEDWERTANQADDPAPHYTSFSHIVQKIANSQELTWEETAQDAIVRPPLYLLTQRIRQ